MRLSIGVKEKETLQSLLLWIQRQPGRPGIDFTQRPIASGGYIGETIPIIAIAVHKNYRRQGIGEKMIEWLVDHASKRNILKLSLMVSKDNHAIRLYRKCGFLEYADQGDSLLMLRETET